MKEKNTNLLNGAYTMTNNEITYKMYASFQYYENYGTPDNSHWKPKGGDDILIMDGITVDMLCNQDDLIAAVSDEMIDKHCWSNDYSQQYFIGFGFGVSNAPTMQDVMDAYDVGIDLEYDNVCDEEPEPIENKYEQLAEALGY